MLLGITPTPDGSLFALRRKDLLSMIKQEYPDVKKGAIVLFANFEQSRQIFRQESSFYYLTGVKEPASVAIIGLDGKATLYIPNHGASRHGWMHGSLDATPQDAKKIHFDAITHLGDEAPGYQLHPFSDKKCYSELTQQLEKIIAQNGTLFTLAPNTTNSYIEQRNLISRINEWIPGFTAACTDISEFVALMRRKKDMREIEAIYKATEITVLAHGAAAQAISEDITEAEVQASLEYMFTGSQARPAFPSIVATGKNATILHYHDNSQSLKNGELVIVDIGAECDYYSADLTRTYPVSGTFTKRQRELYMIVLETQEYIASIAKPGMWLNNKDKPEQSLNHLAKKFLDKKGYGNYMPHGIGHFLGLDTHDVGNLADPIQFGDVFTIEPGIYIPQEGIGIRIEDDYWMAKDGVICLSEALPKKPDDIEAFMQEQEDDEKVDFNQTDEGDFSDDDLDGDEEFDLAQG